MAFPERLRQLRRERFLSQQALADKAGVAKMTVHRLENGVTPPSMRTVRALAAALEVEPGALAHPDEVAERRTRPA